MGALSSKLVVPKKRDDRPDSDVRDRNASLERDVLECNQKRNEAEEGWRAAQDDVTRFEAYGNDLFKRYNQDQEECNQTKMELVNARDGWQEKFRESDNMYNECTKNLEKHSSENNKLTKEIEVLTRDLQECTGKGEPSESSVRPKVLTEARDPMASGNKPTNINMNLLGQIRQGSSLKKASERQVPPVKVSPAPVKKSNAEVVAEKIGQMRRSIADETESESDNEFFDDEADYKQKMAERGKVAQFRSHRVSRSHRSPARRRRSPPPAAKKKSTSFRKGSSRSSRSSRTSRVRKQSPSVRKRSSRRSRGSRRPRGSKSGKRHLY